MEGEVYMIQLSASKLNVFNDCPRCFFDMMKYNVPRPRGIFPSLPGGMDIALKEYAEHFRLSNSVPALLEKNGVPGVLYPDSQVMRRWRNWRTGLTYTDSELGVRVIGALDDAIIDDIIVSPLDWKTRGSAPKGDGSQYYGTQMDVYDLLLSSNNYPTKNKAYLVYFWPYTVRTGSPSGTESHDRVCVEFSHRLYELDAIAERAKETIAKALECLGGNRPDPSPACEYCEYLAQKNNIDEDERSIFA